MSNAAIQLSTEPYDASIRRPMGRNSAGEGFLRGFLQHADVDAFHFWNASGQPQADLEALLTRLGKPDRPTAWLEPGDRQGLVAAGALYIPTPELQREAWARRALGGHAYSLTGVAHTIAETALLDELGALLLAPLEPWDALVCTSEALRKSVETFLDFVADYAHERFGATQIPPAQLVTIPLGVHTADFRADPAARQAVRARLGIAPDAPVALSIGRYSVTAKMHPGPMALALEDASRRLGRPIDWVIYGGARLADDESRFRAAAEAFRDTVRIHFVEHTSSAARDEILAVGDVFFSLSDNIQETFGLTPVEAMAAGLPSVVSDWDGYRDTVRHGVDGFRIRTLSPRAGLGSDLIYAYAQRLISYDDYVGSAALFTAVDIAEAGEALAALFADPELRHRMGAAAQARAREVFDWGAVIPQYQALWRELGRRRAAAPPQPGLENPYRPDPFRMFASYPTAALAPDDTVTLARALAEGEAADLMSRASVRATAARLPSIAESTALLGVLAAGPQTVGDLLAASPPERRPFIERGILWLAKFGLVRLRGGKSRT